MKGGSKYQPLLEYLQNNNSPEITLAFTEIEQLIANALPDSARKQRRWWGNRTTGASQAIAWMNAGYVVGELDLEKERVTFRKPIIGYKVKSTDNSIKWNCELIKALRFQMGLTQSEFAQELGVRQQTVSEWEKGIYKPTRSTSKHLALVADKAGFKYKIPE